MKKNSLNGGVSQMPFRWFWNPEEQMRFPWQRQEREMEQELAHHLYHLAAEYERQGYSPSEARKLAQRAFGGREQIKEQCRDESRWASLSGFFQDLRFGVRTMSRTPVVTLAAVLSLALGIGANTAIVSLMDVVLWRDLPLPAPQQLALIDWQGNHGALSGLADESAGSMWNEGGVDVADFFSYPAFEAIRKGVSGRASVAAFTFPGRVSLSFAGEAMVAQQRSVSGNFFSTLRVRPALGRIFTDADDRDAAPPTAILSHDLWATSFHSDPNVIGKTVTVNNHAQLIVGVLESRFFGLTPGDSPKIYVPLHHGSWLGDASAKSLTNNRAWVCSMLLRRRSGVTDTQLLPALQTLFHSSWARPPKDPRNAPSIRLEGGNRGLGFLRRDFRNSLLILAGFVGLLLLIACTNIVNLLLARAVARQREIAVRISLGCGRSRLIRQFITESALLASAGGLLSIVVGYTAANLLGEFIADPDGLPVAVSLDWRILLIVAAVTLLALLLFGLFPAFRASRSSQINTNRQGVGAFGDRPGRRFGVGRMLVVAQVALSVLLVMAAVVFTRNLLAIQSSDPGFDRRNLVMFDISPGNSGYGKSRLRSFYSNLEQQLRATPGVRSVGLASVRPMNIGGWWEAVRLAGGDPIDQISINSVTPGYLPVYVPHLVAGRIFTRADLDSGANVAIIGEDLAQKLGRNKVLGNFLEFVDGPPGQPPTRRLQIVGIAPAINATSLKDRPLTVWLPLANDAPEVTVVLRTAQRPQLALQSIRKTMAAIDRNLPLVDVFTMDQQVAKGLQRERMFASLCSAFGTLAILLSAVGLYGVISFSTSRRKGEIGVRLALGALPRNVLSMVMREGLALTLLGLAAAALPIVLGAHYLENLLFKMKPLEPVSILTSLAILVAAALIAIGLPALRAALLDPAETLRQE